MYHIHNQTYIISIITTQRFILNLVIEVLNRTGKNRLFSCVGGPWLQPRDQPGAEPGQVRQRAGPGVHPGLQDPLLEGGHDRLQGVPGQHRENGEAHINLYNL